MREKTDSVRIDMYKPIVNKLYKMLCWRDERKRWLTLYDELLADVSLGNFDNEFKGHLLLMTVPLKYYEFGLFRQTIFEVIDYVDNISRIQRQSSI
jgi:hypothetical protein